MNETPPIHHAVALRSRAGGEQMTINDQDLEIDIESDPETPKNLEISLPPGVFEKLEKARNMMLPSPTTENFAVLAILWTIDNLEGEHSLTTMGLDV